MLEKPKLFLDSGAYSAKTQGIEISPYRYVSFLRKWRPWFDVVANLDVIGDGDGTLKNQRLMEELGEKPIPTYHTGEPYSLLEYYVERYPYIALGGNVGRSTDELIGWLDHVWHKYLTNARGLPTVRVHGFGVTSPDIMSRYPWFSVDSTSWLMAAANGRAVICDVDQGGRPWLRTLSVSDKAPDAARDAHYETLRPAERTVWARLVEAKKYDVKTLAEDYRQRFFCNAQAYVEYAEATLSFMPFYPQMVSLFPEPKRFPDRLPVEPWKHLTMYLAGNPGASNITSTLMRRGYNRLLSYHYIIESDGHFSEAREVLKTWPSIVSSAAT